MARRKETCSMCNRAPIGRDFVGGNYCSEDHRVEAVKFYGSFVTTVDTLTVSLQMKRVVDDAEKILQQRYGKVIPRQTNEQLLALFTEILS